MESMSNKVTPPENISTNSDGSRFIPIRKLEDMLDEYQWSTRNLQWQFLKEAGTISVSASIELVIDTAKGQRSFVGACNFPIERINPNSHWLATAKSECIKNAASDISEYLGRGLNDDIEIQKEAYTEKIRPKATPTSSIMQKFNDAVSQGDEKTAALLKNIYEIPTI